ncbi:hypothetical protein RUM44_003231 [Polyplax serrata]|uniref:Beta-hexosaminidase n=1 Tax=Polyplax serrata TaxID=468196 RepID=A0ABR1AXX5_POLSC
MARISFEKTELPRRVGNLLRKAEVRFLNQIMGNNPAVNLSSFGVLHGLNVKLEIYDPSFHLFSTGVDESYRLRITPPSDSNMVQASIEANTFFGLRHGLETLSQLIFYDDIHKVYKIISEAFIEDKPEFTHRDSQSFPYVSSAYPELSTSGAYSSDKVYTGNDIKQIVEEGQSLGIRVVPEFDAPAHVGEGWNALGQDLTTCFKWQPWREFCVEPPCGQFDPTNERVYEILGTIFKEYVELFESDLFHMGGDEVNVNCWRSTPRIRQWMEKMNFSQSTAGYNKLWGLYQEKMLRKLKETKTDPHPQAVLWTSTLTEPDLIDEYLTPEDYIIQIWTSKTDNSIKSLIEKKFRVIFSNYDELYLDCGGPSWVGQQGQNWCSPFIGWQQVYQHSPYDIVKKFGFNMTNNIKKLILGSEAALWTEQIDDGNIHVRLWPRAAALAERLWSNPNETWTEAQFRMYHHRERVVQEVPAEVLQPEWCYQNDGFCD